MAYIYKITNDINDKVYIGKTYNTIEERWREHCKDSKKERDKKRPLYNAMNKYGIENFHIKLIEETSNPEEREKYWIEYYGSFKYGYNATTGGDGRPYVDIDLIIKLWNEGKNNKEIQQITGYDGKTIRNHLKNNGITEEERKQRGKEWQIKSVAMLDKESEEILKVFSTTGETETFLKKPGSRRHVAEVCKGKRKTAYGYKWKYI